MQIYVGIVKKSQRCINGMQFKIQSWPSPLYKLSMESVDDDFNH